MSSKFLSSSGTNVSDGTAVLFGSTIGATSLKASTAIKVNTSGNLYSTTLDIADTTGLQAALNASVSNPATANIDMNANRVVNMSDPVDIGDAVNKQYLEANTGDFKSDGTVQMTGGIAGNGTLFLKPFNGASTTITINLSETTFARNLNMADNKVIGSSAINGDLTLSSTSHGTKGQIIFEDELSAPYGTAALPGYSFTNSLNAGMGSDGLGGVVISSGGSAVATFDAAVTLAADLKMGTNDIISDSTTNSTSAATGAIQTDGGLGVVLDAYIGDDLTVGGDVAVSGDLKVDINTDSGRLNAVEQNSYIIANPTNYAYDPAITSASIVVRDDGLLVGTSSTGVRLTQGLDILTLGTTATTSRLYVQIRSIVGSWFGLGLNSSGGTDTSYGGLTRGISFTSGSLPSNIQEEQIGTWTGTVVDNTSSFSIAENDWIELVLSNTSTDFHIYYHGQTISASPSVIYQITGTVTTSTVKWMIGDANVAISTYEARYLTPSGSMYVDGVLTVGGDATIGDTLTTTDINVTSGLLFDGFIEGSVYPNFPDNATYLDSTITKSGSSTNPIYTSTPSTTIRQGFSDTTFEPNVSTETYRWFIKPINNTSGTLVFGVIQYDPVVETDASLTGSAVKFTTSSPIGGVWVASTADSPGGSETTDNMSQLIAVNDIVELRTANNCQDIYLYYHGQTKSLTPSVMYQWSGISTAGKWRFVFGDNSTQSSEFSIGIDMGLAEINGNLQVGGALTAAGDSTIGGALTVNRDLKYNMPMIEIYRNPAIAPSTTTTSGTINTAIALNFDTDMVVTHSHEMSATTAGVVSYNSTDRARVLHAGMTLSFHCDKKAVIDLYAVSSNTTKYPGGQVVSSGPTLPAGAIPASLISESYDNNNPGADVVIVTHFYWEADPADTITFYISSDTATTVITSVQSNIFTMAMSGSV